MSIIRQNSVPWYGVRTRPNHERTAAAMLQAKGYEQYVPVYTSVRAWSDRKIKKILPLFPGYIFCRFDKNLRGPVASTPGVISVVGFGGEPAAIPDCEIEMVERVLKSGVGAEPCPFLREGQRVRIKRGALEGVEGILVRKKPNWQLVVSVEMLQRSVSVEVDHHAVSGL